MQRMDRALNGVATASYFYPKLPMTLPAIAWQLADDAPAAYADGKPYLTRRRYRIDVFAADLASLSAVCKGADDALTEMGFRRESASDRYDFEERAYRRTALYVRKTDRQGRPRA